MTEEERLAAEAAAAEAAKAEAEKTKEDKEQTIPKHRFDEVYAQMKEFKSIVEAAEAEKAEADKKALESKQEFETLYSNTSKELEDLKASNATTTEKLAAYEKVVNDLVESELKTIDEKFHGLVPNNATPTDKLTWIRQAKEAGMFGDNSKMEIGKPTNVKQPPEDVKDLNPFDLIKKGLKPLKY